MTTSSSFARRDEGIQLLEDVELTGLGTDNVRELTEAQVVFLREARRARLEKQNQQQRGY